MFITTDLQELLRIVYRVQMVWFLLIKLKITSTFLCYFIEDIRSSYANTKIIKEFLCLTSQLMLCKNMSADVRGAVCRI